MSSLGADVLASRRESREPLVVFLEQLVRAESPSSDPASQEPVRKLLASALEELEYRTTRLGGTRASQLYARPETRRRRAPIQLVIGHYDTVWPIGTLASMPFEYDGRIVRGPGVFDMKGGLAQIVFALKTLATLGLEPAVTPCIFLNSDEEIGSRHSTRLITALARRANRALILEPSLGPAGALKTTRKGVGR